MNTHHRLNTRTTAAMSGPKAALLAVAAAAAFFSASAQATVVVGWNFENANIGAQNIAASTAAAGVTAANFNTGNNGVENCCGANGQLSMTRNFGTTVFPSLTFTLASAFSGAFSFNHYHNHNPGFPTTPSYQFDVQLSSDGVTWADIGSDFIASSATNRQQVTLNSLSLGAGTHRIRWVGNNFAFGTDSGSEYFGLDNVQLVAATTQGVPEPATLALAALGLLGAGLARRRTR